MASDRNGDGVVDDDSYNRDNQHAWNAIANFWHLAQSPVGADGKADDGNDMFTECLLPVVNELAEYSHGQTVLDLGAGSGILARLFARKGADVMGLDYSQLMLDIAKRRTDADDDLKGRVQYGHIDLMSAKSMSDFMADRASRDGGGKFDIITISTTLKSLPSLQPIAAALPTMLNPQGRIVVIDLHPAFSKPAGHRGMEILENPETGKQILKTYIKVPQYLHIEPSRSEAVRGQPEPLHVFHRPFWSLLQPFFDNGLVVDAMREPAFHGKPDISQAQSYHNFQQTPMLLAFRLRHKERKATA